MGFLIALIAGCASNEESPPVVATSIVEEGEFVFAGKNGDEITQASFSSAPDSTLRFTQASEDKIKIADGEGLQFFGIDDSSDEFSIEFKNNTLLDVYEGPYKDTDIMAQQVMTTSSVSMRGTVAGLPVSGTFDLLLSTDSNNFPMDEDSENLATQHCGDLVPLIGGGEYMVLGTILSGDDMVGTPFEDQADNYATSVACLTLEMSSDDLAEALLE